MYLCVFLFAPNVQNTLVPAMGFGNIFDRSRRVNALKIQTLVDIITYTCGKREQYLQRKS